MGSRHMSAASVVPQSLWGLACLRTRRGVRKAPVMHILMFERLRPAPCRLHLFDPSPQTPPHPPLPFPPPPGGSPRGIPAGVPPGGSPGGSPQGIPRGDPPGGGSPGRSSGRPPPPGGILGGGNPGHQSLPGRPRGSAHRPPKLPSSPASFPLRSLYQARSHALRFPSYRAL